MNTSQPAALTRKDFAEFFRTFNGFEPFQWQLRLLDHILDNASWPDSITAPTGTGKSSVVEIHVFANAVAASEGVRVPRRLAVVVNRRALVDNQELRATRLQQLLAAEHDEGSIITQVGVALRGLSASGDAGLEVVSLRGGLSRDRGWVDDPTRCTVISATPDMWGSRLLFRGYGSSRFARPREAGMLALDCAMVLDEAHLNRQLLYTARTVAGLIKRDSSHLGVPTLQVVETTATPSAEGHGSEVGVTDADVAADPVLYQRIHAAKQLRLAPLDSWPKPSRDIAGKPTKDYFHELAEEVVRLVDQHGPTSGGRTVGCFVNRVETAAAVARDLRERGYRVELRVGPMRAYDLLESVKRKPGLYTTAGDPETDVLVATQTIEVGADIDLHSAVSELAGGSALVQRAGRVNRLGRSDDSEFVVAVPGEKEKLARTGPYSIDDMRASMEWLEALVAERESIAPNAVSSCPAPTVTPSRLAFQFLTTSTASRLARTSSPLFAEPSLDLYLRDSLELDPAAGGVVVRELPRDDDAALGLLREVPPEDVEVLPTSLSELVPVVEGVMQGDDHSRAFIYRDDDVSQLDGTSRLRPGDVIVVDPDHKIATAGVITGDRPDRVVPVPPGELSGRPQVEIDPEPDTVLPQTDAGRRYAAFAEEAMASAETGFSNGERGRTLVVGAGLLDRPAWIVARDDAIEASGDARMQVEGGGQAVRLMEHQRDVAQRADAVTNVLGVASGHAAEIVSAGLHHDDGKRDQRFQRLLDAGYREGEPELAKSGMRTSRERQLAWANSGMISGWRHEQLSVVYAVECGIDSPLALRLIGTSHGRGRPVFDHATSLSDDPEIRCDVHEMFVAGGWTDLIVATQREYGEWGCAYLETLLRAADGQVSSEGR